MKHRPSRFLFSIAVCIVLLSAAAGCRCSQCSISPLLQNDPPPPATPEESKISSLATLRRAFIEKQHVADAIAFEKTLEENSTRFAPEGTPWFTVKKGASRILISAPHATHPTRHGELRGFADPGSGSLAEMLHRLADVTVIYTTYASPSDPNYYDDNDYKRALAKLLEEEQPLIVLDLHVSNHNRPYDLDIGTMNGHSLHGADHLAARLLEILREEGMRNFSANYFNAGSPYANEPQTVTRFVSAKGVPCVQLELNSTWTCAGKSDAHAHRFGQLLQGMIRFIREVNDKERP